MKEKKFKSKWWQLYDLKRKRFYYYNCYEEKTSWTKPDTDEAEILEAFDQDEQIKQFFNLKQGFVPLASKIIEYLTNNMNLINESNMSLKELSEKISLDLNFEIEFNKDKYLVLKDKYGLSDEEIFSMLNVCSTSQSSHSNGQIETVTSNETNTNTLGHHEKRRQPRTNPNYVKVDLINKKDGSFVKNTYVYVDQVNKDDSNSEFKHCLSTHESDSSLKEFNYQHLIESKNPKFSQAFFILSLLIDNNNLINDSLMKRSRTTNLGHQNKLSRNSFLSNSSNKLDKSGKLVDEDKKFTSLSRKTSTQNIPSSSSSLIPNSAINKSNIDTSDANLNSTGLKSRDDFNTTRRTINPTPFSRSFSNKYTKSSKMFADINETLCRNDTAPSLADLNTAFSPSLSDLRSFYQQTQNQLNQKIQTLRRSLNQQNNSKSRSQLSEQGKKPAESSHDLNDLVGQLDLNESDLNNSVNNLEEQPEKSNNFLFFSKKKDLNSEKEQMTWSSQTIQKPLIKTNNKNLKREACEIFKLIQIYMGDRKLTSNYFGSDSAKPIRNLFSFLKTNSESNTTKGSNQATQQDMVCLEIIKKGWTHTHLRDELFLQLIKQTTQNKNKDSFLFGWQLLAVCLSFFPPSHKLYPLLKDYINYNFFENTLGNLTEPMNDLLLNSNFSTFPIEILTEQNKTNNEMVLKEKLLKTTYVCRRRLERIHVTGAKRGLKYPSIEEIILSKQTIMRPSLFGTTLVEIMYVQQKKFSHLSLPWIQTTLSEAVLKLNGAKTEGIFRVPGDLDEVNNLKVQFDQLWCTEQLFANSIDDNQELDLLKNIKDPHLPASLLKLWYRELYDPLIPNDFYDECINNCDKPDKCIMIIDKLPNINKLVFTYLIRFLKVFAAPENVALTKMDANNLSMIMAPNCLRCQSNDPKIIMENTKKEMQFIKTLIQHLDTSIVQGL